MYKKFVIQQPYAQKRKEVHPVAQISFQMEKKCNVSTNEYGQPNLEDENCKVLITSIRIMSRTHIPII